MLELPKSTELNKRIPKQKFYENLQISPALRKCFVEQIHSIIWKNKIAPATINLAAGSYVDEIQVFCIRLNSDALDESVLKQIDRDIPYHILFILEFNGKVQAWIGYKEEAESGASSFKVNRYYHTDWIKPEEQFLKLDGLDMDAVYENLVRQIAGDMLGSDNAETLHISYERSVQREKLLKQIASLEKKAWNEKQPRRKVMILQELSDLKAQLKEVSRSGQPSD
ncbi:MAG: DUF4391 domain-containing protein [Clostridia bacterium]|nr:DUF4391 domain-containing protein [Clostridia bacterium]MBR4577771.1 DUF4391 domain-containing protein [Clostridia bacterium]